METTPEVAPASGSRTPTSAQEQARLRRERRNAKIVAGSSSRLNKITSMSGRPAAADEGMSHSIYRPPSSRSAPTPSAPQSSQIQDDPAEVDISQDFYTTQPAMRPSRSENAQQMPPDLAQMQQLFASANRQPQDSQSTTGHDDPMLNFMSQILGGGAPFGGSRPAGPGQGDGSADGPPNLPPGLAQMLGALSGSGTSPQQQPEPPRTGYIWRIVHAVFALLLASYMTLSTSFTGSRLARAQTAPDGADASAIGPRLFYMFATAQLVLQSSRYFLEKGRLPQSGVLGGLSQMLPEPYAGYFRVWSRYSIIFSTVVADAMVVVFVMGVLAWWRGGATASASVK